MKKGNPVIFRFTAFWVVSLLMPLLYANATSVSDVSIDEMVQKSQFVFEGRVIAAEARSTQARIHTYITFEIIDVLKGEYNGNIIILRFLGGTLGDVTLAVSDMQLPQKGEHGIYFVESLERIQINPLFGWSQGHFIVYQDGAGIERVMTNKGLPVTGVKGDTLDQRKVTEHAQTLSQGVSRDVVVAQDGKRDNGLTTAEFKKILHKRMIKKTNE
jgi:hypothetical protein